MSWLILLVFLALLIIYFLLSPQLDGKQLWDRLSLKDSHYSPPLAIEEELSSASKSSSSSPEQLSGCLGSSSKGEQICCQVLEKIFQKPFTKARPSFLRNPETGRNLELDCYNEELGIAVEYNGQQHYTWPNFTRMSRQEFHNQLRRDRFKKEVCALLGIKLIIVPYTVKHSQIENYLLEKLGID